MIFEKRIAKIGKGNNLNLYAKNNKEIEVFLNTNGIVKKVLNVVNEKYGLVSSDEYFAGREVVKLDTNTFLIRTQNNLFLEQVYEKSN